MGVHVYKTRAEWEPSAEKRCDRDKSLRQHAAIDLLRETGVYTQKIGTHIHTHCSGMAALWSCRPIFWRYNPALDWGNWNFCQCERGAAQGRRVCSSIYRFQFQVLHRATNNDYFIWLLLNVQEHKDLSACNSFFCPTKCVENARLWQKFIDMSVFKTNVNIFNNLSK